jgi:hypothetical protein
MTTDALVLPPRRPDLDRVRVGGLPLVERAALTLHHAGMDRILVSGARLTDAGLPARLARRGVTVTRVDGDSIGATRAGGGLVVVSADVLFDARAVAALMAAGQQDGARGVSAPAALGGLLVYLPPPVVDRLRGCVSIPRALFLLYRAGGIANLDPVPGFCRPVPPDGRTWRVERDYLRHRGGDGLLARAMRAFSVPTSQVLLRLGLWHTT